MRVQHFTHKHTAAKAILALALAMTGLGAVQAQDKPMGCYRPKSEEVNGRTVYARTPVVSSPPLTSESSAKPKFILTSNYPFHGIGTINNYIQLEGTMRSADFPEGRAIGWAHMSTLVKVDPGFCK